MLFAVSMRVRPLNLETPKVAEEVEAPLKKVPVPVQLERVKQPSIEKKSWTDQRDPGCPGFSANMGKTGCWMLPF